MDNILKIIKNNISKPNVTQMATPSVAVPSPITSPTVSPSGGQTKDQEPQQQINTNKPFLEGLVTVKDIIAPGSIEVDFNFVRIDDKYYRTLFITGYPRFVGINWLSSLINFDAGLSISMYIYPTDGKEVLDDLRRKIAEMEAELSTDIQRGRAIDPATQAKLEDALTLQNNLVKGEERFFQFGLYVTITANSKEDLDRINKNIEAALGALMIISKKATLQMEDGFLTTLPSGNDRLNTTRNMDTTSLATTFPFVSSDLSDDKGIMYGINMHNGSMVIFDRFNMQNYNSVVFATAGAGKSYMIKLEALRSLMMGTDIIVIDPENEYKELCESVGGQYIAFGYNESSKINPFDLSLVVDEGENSLNAKILSLHKLFTIMIGKLDPMEESVLDRAIMDAYKMKGVTPDPETQTREAPLLEDLYKSLIGMEDDRAQSLAARFEKYIKGSFMGLFNQKTTVRLDNRFVVFGIRNLEESLRPIAMQIILDHIWTIVKKTLRKRILIVDEAWYLMQYEDSASFLRGIVKRGRKYYLGVTTITQDVDDFLATPFGKEIVTNSAIQILLKQHTAAIDLIGQTFYLSEGEKQLLLAANKGEGIFFAGQNHVAISVIASQEEHNLITSNPEDILKMKEWTKNSSGLKEELKSNVLPSENIESTEKEEPQVKVSLGQIKTETEEVLSPEINKEEKNEPRDMIKTEVVVPLQKKIEEMEGEEKKKIKEFELNQQKQSQDIKKNEEIKKSSLPKYQELFKSLGSTGTLPKLPPLPPLPKYETTIKQEPAQINPINIIEKQIPQPPQLKRKPTEPVVLDKKIEIVTSTAPPVIGPDTYIPKVMEEVLEKNEEIKPIFETKPDILDEVGVKAPIVSTTSGIPIMPVESTIKNVVTPIDQANTMASQPNKQINPTPTNSDLNTSEGQTQTKDKKDIDYDDLFGADIPKNSPIR